MVSPTKFKNLLEPYHIGKITTKNRIIKTAAGSGTMPNELYITETAKAYYGALARGGVGLIIVESPTIDYPLGTRRDNRYRLDDDKYIKGLSELTKVIHKYNCPALIQMYHSGNWESAPDFPSQPIAASPVTIKSELDKHNEEPRELSIPEIKELVDKLAAVAVRAQKAGFDGVELNSSCSHMLNSFLSRFWNRRQDAYGGSLENRARFLVELIQEIKKRAGQDFVVTALINGIEVGKILGIGEGECITLEESQGIAQILEKAGVDAIQVRSHWFGYHVGAFIPDALFYPEPPIPLKSFPKEYDYRYWGKGANLPLAAAFKKAISIPVITVGRLDPELGEKVLREGGADFIGMTRRLLADPELPNKLASGRFDDIAPCTACGGCLNPAGVSHCRVNAALGSDDEYIIKPADKKKKVVVVGGGPAGMEAARVASLRGHEVTIYDRASKLGGLLSLAALVKGFKFEDLPTLIRYLKDQITKLGVRIKLGQDVTASAIEGMNPDVAIIATGGVPALPEIPGINGRNVISGAKLHNTLKLYLRFLGPKFLRWLTKFWMPVGKNVVIIGGAIQGCQLGEFLVKRGRKVTIVDTAETLGEGLPEHTAARLLLWFAKKDVTLLTGVRYEEITDKGLTVITGEGERKSIPADSIIIAMPFQPDTALLKSLEGKVPEVYAIGDCSEPGLIMNAIAEGSRIARAI